MFTNTNSSRIKLIYIFPKPYYIPTIGKPIVSENVGILVQTLLVEYIKQTFDAETYRTL